MMNLKAKLAQYAPIRLTADFTHLSDNDRQILNNHIDAVHIPFGLAVEQRK